MRDLGRRDFLRIVGLAGTSAAVGGCSESGRRLIPYIIPPEDIIPGEAVWYSTTCRECPAGCGLLAKNRDGRVVKAEGNPQHPVSGGTLCARGQASLHGLYNPDRFKGPLYRNSAGKLDSISWESGEEILLGKLKDIIGKGRGERIVFLTELTTGVQKDLVSLWLAELGQAGGPVLYEPFAYEALRKANQAVFGYNGIPAYRIDQADFLISFNAGFLETWLSNLEYSRQFGSFRSIREGRKNPFVFVGPRLSMTAANADLWIPVAPGDEYLIALGMLRVIVDEKLAATLRPDQVFFLRPMLEQWPLEKITAKTGVSEQTIRSIAQQFAGAARPLALAEGLSLSVPNATATAVAANLLCTVNPGTQLAIDSEAPSSYSEVASAEAMKVISGRMRRGEIDVLLIHNVNPVFSLPASWEFRKSMESVPMVVSFSSMRDETSALANLVLPTHTPFESWGDYSPRKGIVGLMQPVMGPMFQTRQLEEILISTGAKLKGPDRFPWKDSYELLRAGWMKRWQETDRKTSFEAFWQEALRKGGIWETGKAKPSRLTMKLSSYAFPDPDSGSDNKSGKEFYFTAYPTVQFYDGREANRPWIQELPDPMTMTTWGGWVEIHPETAAKLGIKKGDMLEIKSPYGSIEVPANPIFTVPTGALAVPVGQGHTDFGRFADGLPANPMLLYPADLDKASGGILLPAFGVSIEKTGRKSAIANTDGSFYDYGREILETVTLEEHMRDVASRHKPHIDLPLPEGFDPEKDFYPTHAHTDYRWCMVVDIDRCTGCGACVVACYAENNVAIVGREQVLNGREMSWLRIQRYFDPKTHAARWLPMLCQHCDAAPCEPVCPIYAPHHSKDGLNNQVYNRCFGTRFCSQNDPYKVRRFNYFTYTRPEPLNWQLNPDVTVRQKGVMEKCSFCVQRIVEAKIRARNEDRKVRDGEFTTACAQTCPTGALMFGNLLDPDERLRKLMNDPRAYQVLGHLNTKPGIVYLKKVTREVVTL